MERTIVIFLALSVCLVQCASLKGNDDPPHGPSHKRGKRCDVCGDAGPPPPPGPPLPPPPPPFFRTLQYSGLSRSVDGRQGVFSGAAAAADLNNQAAGQAFSVASSSARAGGYGGQNRQSGYNGQSSQTQSSGFGGQSAQHSYDGQSSQSQSNGFGGQSAQQLGFGSQSSNSQSQLARGDSGLSSAKSAAQSGNAGGYGQKQISGFGSFKESRYSFQSGENKNIESNGGSSGGFDADQVDKLQGSAHGGQQQNQNRNSAGFGHEVERIGHGDKQSHLESENQQQFQSSGNGKWQTVHGSQHGFGSGDQQQTQSLGNGQWEQGGSNSVGASQSGAFSGAGKSSYGASGSESSGHESIGDGQSALSGALNLASQGLQTAQQTQSGCSTCGSGSYALSNAKSKSGNAVAVSIGG